MSRRVRNPLLHWEGNYKKVEIFIKERNEENLNRVLMCGSAYKQASKSNYSS